jgi:hypothetical protein
LQPIRLTFASDGLPGISLYREGHSLGHGPVAPID